jgi:hypothetical protein
MAKAPAIQWYIGDWFKDPAVQAGEAATRGVWANLLMYMWESKPRGVLTGTMEQMRKLANCKEHEWPVILSEIKELLIADVTEANGKITIKNRRMYREQKEKENNRLRQGKFRKNHQSNDEITPPSSSSSSSSLKNTIKSEGEKPENGKVTPPEINASVLAVFKKFMELFPKGPDRVVPGSAKIEIWFREHQKNGADFALLIAAVRKYRNSKQVNDGYIMNPMKFLDQWRDWGSTEIPKAPAKEVWMPDPKLIFGNCTRPGCSGMFQEFSYGARTKSECTVCHDPYKPPEGTGEEARKKVREFKMQGAT